MILHGIDQSHQGYNSFLEAIIRNRFERANDWPKCVVLEVKSSLLLISGVSFHTKASEKLVWPLRAVFV